MQYSVKLIALVLVFSLLSGVGGYYLGSLSTSGSPPAKTANTSSSPLPSASTASSSSTFNPFSSATSSATTNPFDTKSSYSNPFSNVKGASTGYINPFDTLVNGKPLKNYRGF